MLIQFLILIISLVALYYGAEFSLNSSEKVGKYFGLSPLVIGLLIVGFGTSLPELFVSQMACYRGFPGLAVGNIVGSNIANLFLVMGLTAVLVPLHLTRRDIRFQTIFHLGLTLILSIVLLQSRYSLWSSLILGLFFIFYLAHSYHEMKLEQKSGEHALFQEDEVEHVLPGVTPVDLEDQHPKINYFDFLKLCMGFGLLYLGGEYLVDAGNKLGVALGISHYVLSAIFVAFGTSFPELVTSLLAYYKKKDTDLVIGNIIGSNIFNVAFVLVSLGFYKIEFQRSYYVELGSLFFASVVLLLLSVFKKSLARFLGIIFLMIYLGMVFYWLN